MAYKRKTLNPISLLLNDNNMATKKPTHNWINDVDRYASIGVVHEFCTKCDLSRTSIYHHDRTERVYERRGTTVYGKQKKCKSQ